MQTRIEKLTAWLKDNQDLIEKKDGIKIEIHLKGDSTKPAITFYDEPL